MADYVIVFSDGTKFTVNNVHIVCERDKNGKFCFVNSDGDTVFADPNCAVKYVQMIELEG